MFYKFADEYVISLDPNSVISHITYCPGEEPLVMLFTRSGVATAITANCSDYAAWVKFVQDCPLLVDHLQGQNHS